MADELNPQEGIDTGTEGADERPEWLPANFKTPEDMAKSYKELERTFHQTREDLRATRASVEEMAAQQQQAQRPQEPGYDNEQWMEAYERDPIRTTAYIAQQAALQQFQQLQAQAQQQYGQVGATQHELVANYAKATLQARYDDWQSYEDKVADAIREDPSLVPENVLSSPELAARSLERVYKVLKADETLARSQESAQTQAQAGRQNKLAAQTMPGASSGATRAGASADDDYHARAAAVHKGGSPYGTL